LTQISFSFSDLLRLREEKAKLKEIECNLLQKQEQLKENDMNQTQQTISSLESQIESLKSKVPFNLSTFVATI
jgi:DNA repair exonuclease SbcCD ATPase subunit